MTMLRSIFVALVLLWAGQASAQTGLGQIPAWNVVANPTSSAARSKTATITQMFDGAFCGTTDSMLLRGASVWACQTLPSCSSTTSAIKYLLGTGFTCRTDAASLTATGQTFSGGANVTPFSIGTVASGTTTISCGNGPLQFFTNGGASTIAAPAADGSCIVYMLNNGSAGSIAFSGFTVSTNTGDSLTTTNTNKFFISIVRINGISNYVVRALQ